MALMQLQLFDFCFTAFPLGSFPSVLLFPRPAFPASSFVGCFRLRAHSSCSRWANFSATATFMN
jgi:hypothetical protein